MNAVLIRIQCSWCKQTHTSYLLIKIISIKNLGLTHYHIYHCDSVYHLFWHELTERPIRSAIACQVTSGFDSRSAFNCWISSFVHIFGDFLGFFIDMSLIQTTVNQSIDNYIPFLITSLTTVGFQDPRFRLSPTSRCSVESDIRKQFVRASSKSSPSRIS